MAQKRKTAAIFVHKIALRLKKVFYKVSFCELKTVSDKDVIGDGLTNRAKIIDGGGRPLLPEILGQSDRVGAKSPISDLFSPVAPQP